MRQLQAKIGSTDSKMRKNAKKTKNFASLHLGVFELAFFGAGWSRLGF
jgi:hypothetical protein